jgi:hypothetical protein
MRVPSLLGGVALFSLVPGCFEDTGSTDTDTAGTGSAGTETSGTETSGTETGEDAPSCANYCTTIQAACADPATNQQYLTEAACMVLCEFMDPGTIMDVTGDTVGCRYHWAVEATELEGDALAQACRRAGHGGDGTCGGNCSSLCELAAQTCTGALQQWSLIDACITECAALPEDPPYSTSQDQNPGVACRLYHLQAAATNAATHCPHVGGEGPCAPP